MRFIQFCSVALNALPRASSSSIPLSAVNTRAPTTGSSSAAAAQPATKSLKIIIPARVGVHSIKATSNSSAPPVVRRQRKKSRYNPLGGIPPPHATPLPPLPASAPPPVLCRYAVKEEETSMAIPTTGLSPSSPTAGSSKGVQGGQNGDGDGDGVYVTQKHKRSVNDAYVSLSFFEPSSIYTSTHATGCADTATPPSSSARPPPLSMSVRHATHE